MGPLHDIHTDTLIAEVKSRGYVVQAQQTFDNEQKARADLEERAVDAENEVCALEQEVGALEADL